MNEIKCPQCGTVFQVDEQGYADIARQVRDQEFSRQLAERERIMERERAAAVELAEQKAERQLQETVSGRDARIAELEGQITEAAKTAESAEKLRAEMDELRRQGDEQRIGFELQMAGCLNLPRFRLHPCAAFRAAPPRCPASNSAGLRFPSAEWILTLS